MTESLEEEREYTKYLAQIDQLEKDQKEREQQWDKYFMKIACLTALRSKDPRTAVGACIADTIKHEVVGIGYNSMPYIKGKDNDEKFKWKGNEIKKEDLTDPELKYPYVVHAAVNAVTNRTREFLTGCTIYLTLHPDCDCAHAIIRSGIKSIKYCMITSRVPSEMSDARKLLEETKDMKLYPMCSKQLKYDWTCKTCLNGKKTQKCDSPMFCSKTTKNDFVEKLRERNYNAEVSTTAYKGELYLSWEQFFMQIAKLSAERPGIDTDKGEIQGACIVSSNKQVMSIGASGFPADLNIKSVIKDKETDTCKYVRHAEYRAILGGPSVKGCTLYVTKYPCHKCAQVIVQSGITEVVYEIRADKVSRPEKVNSYKSSKKILTECLGEGKIRKYKKKEVPPLFQLALQEIYKHPLSYYSIAFTLCVLLVLFILYNRSPD